MQQVTVLPKDRPENLWHGKTNADVPDITKQGSHRFLPQEGGTIAAARASSRLAGVVKECPFSGWRGVDFGTQSCGSAIKHSQEVVTHGRAGLGSIPQVSCSFQNLP